jgi:hypothetical protein
MTGKPCRLQIKSNLYDKTIKVEIQLGKFIRFVKPDVLLRQFEGSEYKFKYLRNKITYRSGQIRLVFLITVSLAKACTQ